MRRNVVVDSTGNRASMHREQFMLHYNRKWQTVRLQGANRSNTANQGQTRSDHVTRILGFKVTR
jgi:hypothetical protein